MILDIFYFFRKSFLIAVPCIFLIINSRLLKCCTARGPSSELSLGPNKVKARKSFLFTEGFLKVENKEHLVELMSHKSISFCSFGVILC